MPNIKINDFVCLLCAQQNLSNDPTLLLNITEHSDEKLIFGLKKEILTYEKFYLSAQ